MSHIEAKRKKGESFDAMFRRWSRRVQQSGKILDVRAGRFFERKPKKNKLKTSTLRGIEIGEKRSYLIRSGKATEEDFRRRRRR